MDDHYMVVIFKFIIDKYFNWGMEVKKTKKVQSCFYLFCIFHILSTYHISKPVTLPINMYGVMKGLPKFIHFTSKFWYKFLLTQKVKCISFLKQRERYANELAYSIHHSFHIKDGFCNLFWLWYLFMYGAIMLA